MKSSKTLPTDMFFEILSRGSFETVERSKAVSKELRRIINDPTFLSLHCKRTNSLFGYYFQTWRGHIVKSEFVSDNDDDVGVAAIKKPSMQILASCDLGILCCQSRVHKKERYYVCKPATQQWQPLPNPKLRYHTVVVALVVLKSHPLCYTIVRLSHPQLTHECICEIFDSRNWAWERIQGPHLPDDRDFIASGSVAVTVGKSVSWLTVNDNVLTLDLNERNFQCFPLPETVNSDDGYNRKKLMKYAGGLGLTRLTNDGKAMEIWVAERQRWTRKTVVDMKFAEGRWSYPQMVDFFCTDAAFIKLGDESMLCNFRDCIFSTINVNYDPSKYVDQIFRFRSDFEAVDLKPPMRNRRSRSRSGSSVKSGVRRFVESLVQEICAGLQRFSKTKLVSCYFPPRILSFISR